MWRPISEAPDINSVVVAEISNIADVPSQIYLHFPTTAIKSWNGSWFFSATGQPLHFQPTHYSPLPPPVVGKPHTYIEVPTPNGFGYVRADESPKTVTLDAAKCTKEAVREWEKLQDFQTKYEDETFIADCLAFLAWAKVMP
jgi:hypothetical protein